MTATAQTIRELLTAHYADEGDWRDALEEACELIDALERQKTLAIGTLTVMTNKYLRARAALQATRPFLGMSVKGSVARFVDEALAAAEEVGDE